MNNEIYEKLINITDKQNVLIDEPMKNHTTFKVGGSADYYVIPQNITEAAEIVRLLLRYNIPYYVVGNGSNLLVSDDGFRGVIISISKGLDYINIDGNELTVGAGALLSKVASVAINNGLKGLVFASGIPGSIGGAVVMNAGAYGGEMKDVIKEVTLFDIATSEIVTLSNEDMKFSYRNSVVKSHQYIVLSAVITCENGNVEELKAEAVELATKRKEKQPLEYPSAGSTFKRPEGYFAGKLIEDAGLKGYCVGGAQVSQKHSGFVINKGGATATDIITLINDVRAKVYSEYGVVLEPEVCMLGNDLDINSMGCK